MFSVRVHKTSKCETVDNLIPESREDLITPGVDVENYDKMANELFCGAIMNK